MGMGVDNTNGMTGLQVEGFTKKVGTPVVTVLRVDGDGYVCEAKGVTVPTDGDAGYAKGCIFTDTDASLGAILFVNEGSATSADFNVIESAASNITGVTAGAGLTGGGTSGTVTLTVANTDGNLTVGADSVDFNATGISTAKHTITSADASSLAVGRLGATTPALLVDASTASSITGVKVKSAGTGGGVAISAVGETNVNTTLDAAGSGTLTLNGTATGNVVLGRAATGVSLGLTGAASMLTGTAVPATAGAVAAGAPLVLNSNLITIEATTDAPTHTRPKGSLCINLGGSSASTRLYVNTDGAGTWTSVTTAA